MSERVKSGSLSNDINQLLQEGFAAHTINRLLILRCSYVFGARDTAAPDRRLQFARYLYETGRLAEAS